MDFLKLLLVDDHQILIDGIKNMLEDSDNYIIIEAESSVSAMEILNNSKIDIIITDIQMPEEDGIELIKKVKKIYPDIKIVVLSMHDEKSIVMEAINLGVNAYLLKNISQKKLITALEKVQAGAFYISEEISHIIIESINMRNKGKLLSDRELEILKLISKELSNKKIADKLFISERTVESHRKNIFAKTNTKTVVGLIKYAIKNKLITE